MISRLHVKGFKSLADTTVDLGAVNVFIGANGSGKSNLLEAVGTLSALVSSELITESLRYRGVRVGPPASYCSAFRTGVQSHISISVSIQETDYSAKFAPDNDQISKWNIVSEDILNLDKTIIHKDNNGLTVLDKFHTPFSSKITLLGILSYVEALTKSSIINSSYKQSVEVIQDRFQDLSRYAIFSPSTPQLRGFIDDIQREPLGLGGSGLGRAINEMVDLNLETLGPFDLDDVYELIDWADGIELDLPDPSAFMTSDMPVRLRIRDRYMGQAHKSVSATEASEGALYVLFLLALVGHPDSPKMFGIDNFDQALHPNLACALTRLVADQIVKDGSRQMLATTHNPLVLDGLNLLDDRIRLFAVERDSNGATQVNRITVTPELMAQAEAGLSLSRLWVMGRLGGVPRNL